MPTCKIGGTPNGSVSEAAMRNSNSSLREKLYREPRAMQIYGTVTANSDNGMVYTFIEYSHGPGTVLSTSCPLKFILFPAQPSEVELLLPHFTDENIEAQGG